MSVALYMKINEEFVRVNLWLKRGGVFQQVLLNEILQEIIDP